MQVSIETTSGLERRLTIGVPADTVEGEIEKRLKEAAKNIRLNGFRKGKVPMKVVKQRYGAGVRQEVVGELISRSFYEAARKEDVKPAGQPSIQPKELSEGKDLEFVATFEVYPEVELKNIEGFDVTRYTAVITDEDIDNMIEILRKQAATWEQVERASADGDQVNIDFTGTKDGVEFDGGKASGHNLVLGSNSMIPGFEAGIVGMKAGEEKTIKVTFPEDYQSDELKGAEAEFLIKVNSVAEQTLPELKKAFFQQYGLEKGGIKAFQKEVKANMERELKNALKAKVKSQVMDKLIESHEVDLPKALVANEVNVLRNQMMQRFGQQPEGFDAKSLLPDSMFEEDAKRRVSLGLIVGEVVKSAQLKADAKAVKKMVEEIATTYEDPAEVVEYYYSQRELLAGVESAVLEDQVVEHILAKADVKEETATYDEIMQPQKAEK
ncbi:trigger factor [Gilvimarinus sp. SDUM040013]|uniref:Trigger factor n=1 Tax=Gilvimarinus gilvus TaxID=3058038 RepID=A0ABU4RYV0_9GAMM|nr:trigger factor [Gilvimarinus sp. SDUM040013]MDO3385703.1 trigger factor [Gilvimarinus sp. SDUM040013]MDX6849341.1 trigger factor [Gilvimarinus sp. SDUM040013]